MITITNRNLFGGPFSRSAIPFTMFMLFSIANLSVAEKDKAMPEGAKDLIHAERDWVNATLVSISPKLQEQLPYNEIRSAGEIGAGGGWTKKLLSHRFQPPEGVLGVLLPMEERDVPTDVLRTRYVVDGFDITISEVSAVIAFDVACREWAINPPAIPEIENLAQRMFVGAERISLAVLEKEDQRDAVFSGVIRVKDYSQPTLPNGGLGGGGGGDVRPREPLRRSVRVDEVPSAITKGVWDIQYERVVFVFGKYVDGGGMSEVGFGKDWNSSIISRGNRDRRERDIHDLRQRNHRDTNQ